MLFVRCMVAWRASLGPAPIPISRSMAALSTAPKAGAGGKSTTRKIEPRVGGAMPWRGRRTSAGERPEAEFPLGLRYRGGVSRRNAPVIVPVGRPFPVFGLSGPVRAADALDFGGVLHRGAERRNEIREDVVAGPVTPGTPKGRYPRVLHPSDTAHDRIDVGHFERDVIEQGIVRLRVGERVVDAVAAHEIHKPSPI